MIRSGLIAVVALCLCVVASSAAFGAGAASAASLESCTMQAPGEPTATFYLDSKCKEEDMSGNYHWLKTSGAVKPELSFASAQQISGTILGKATSISCTTLKTLAGSSEENVTEAGVAKVKGTLLLQYGGCAITEPAGCALGSPNITSEALTLLATTTGGVSSVKLTSAARLFAIKITGCASAGTYALSGTLVGTVPAADESLIEFTAGSGSTVKFGSAAATYIGSTRAKKEGTEQTLFIHP